MNNIKEESWQMPPEVADRHANTTSSMYLQTTISKPNVESIVQSVATIIHSQMLEDMEQNNQPIQGDLYFFSEEKYIEDHPEAFDQQRLELLRKTPTVDNIYEFIKALFDCAQFSPECCIICLIYINRLIAFTGVPLHPSNWRPLVLCSLLVAQKVWDDRYLSNADFAYIYPFFTTEEINKLEQKFLELIQYGVTVKSSLYAKYYFELRALFKENVQEFPLEAIDKVKMAEIEGRSAHIGKVEKAKYEKFGQTYTAKPQGVEEAKLDKKGRAVIS